MIDDIRGVGFPFRIDSATGGVAWAKGADKLRQNIRVLLGTRLGERPMLRDYGTRLHSLVHEPNDDVLADLVKTQAQQALLKWESRVLVTETHVEQTDSTLKLHIRYVHTTEPVADELVLPLG